MARPTRPADLPPPGRPAPLYPPMSKWDHIAWYVVIGMACAFWLLMVVTLIGRVAA